MNMGDTEKQIDDDILKSRQDVLRAKDIIPSTSSAPASQQKSADIPKLDLGKQIMAQHRKVTAVKRKSPGQPIAAKKAVAKPSVNLRVPEPPTASKYNPLIAEIVSRDIKRLYSGEILSV